MTIVCTLFFCFFFWPDTTASQRLSHHPDAAGLTHVHCAEGGKSVVTYLPPYIASRNITTTDLYNNAYSKSKECWNLSRVFPARRFAIAKKDDGTGLKHTYVTRGHF